MALLPLTLKLGGVISGALLGRGLSIIGWDASTTFAPEDQRNLLAMAWMVPLVGALVCLAAVGVLKGRPAAVRRLAAWQNG